eukprot:SAG31_NODE_4431_length_3236_cov_2.397832_6_plen_95_part_01
MNCDNLQGFLDLEHTWTPVAQRGMGRAARVVRAAFEYAKFTGRKIVPSCTYIPTFVARNPELAGQCVASGTNARSETTCCAGQSSPSHSSAATKK